MFTTGLIKVILRCVLIGTITAVGEFIACIIRRTMDEINLEE